MRTHLIRVVILAALVILAIAPSAVLAQERITSYSSNITVNKDATMVVQETIKVISEQNQIKHGIYRDFPTRYKDRNGNGVVVEFQVQSVTRDGAPEPYRTEGMSNGVRVYIGDATTYVPSGAHIYTLNYTTNRQLGFFEDHDELYWNVTGNGWVFPIEKAAATIALPAEIAASNIKVDGWTGAKDSKDKNLKASADANGRAVFYTTSVLNSYEGLTIAVSWPKGFITEPAFSTRTHWFLRDNISTLICALGLLIVFGYFGWAHMNVGIDPSKGAIVPQWDPPDGMSPAAVRYISKMKFDNKALSCAMINAAVKGHIEISEKKGEYTIKRKTDGKVPLSFEESAAVEGLLRSTDSIVMEQSNNAVIRGAIDLFTKSLNTQFGKGYFATHTGYAVVGALLSVLTLFVALLADSGDPETLFLSGWLALWSIGTAVLVTQVVKNWREVGHNPKSCVSAGCLTLFAVPFVAAEVVVLVVAAGSISIPMIVAVFLFACMNIAFFKLLRAYTKKGRALMDKAEGLKLYMTVAEQERLNVLHPPDRTPELFEKLLPYALALDVENQWSERFADVLAKAQAEGYQPSWYAGSAFHAGSYAGFASSVGSSFSSAISSSSVAPGSSSGFSGGGGGGGSSGGGGGGGGGGGW